MPCWLHHVSPPLTFQRAAYQEQFKGGHAHDKKVIVCLSCWASTHLRFRFLLCPWCCQLSAAFQAAASPRPCATPIISAGRPGNASSSNTSLPRMQSSHASSVSTSLASSIQSQPTAPRARAAALITWAVPPLKRFDIP